MKGDKSAMKTDKKKKTTKKRKVVEGPIKPKRPDRPASALCAFVKEFSEREENINKRTIYKECMKEWNEMTEKVRGQYISKAKRRMAAYEKKLQIYKREIEADDNEDGNGREEADDKEDGNGREED